MEASNIIGGTLMGFVVGLFVGLMVNGASERDSIDECEAKLPRTQHCEIIKTAEVVK